MDLEHGGNLQKGRQEVAVLPYEPTNTLQRVDEGVWIVDGPIVRMSLPAGSLPFPTRMTVIRLRSGELLLHSPTQVEARLQAELEALGPVRHLISPNWLHYAHVGDWKRLYPGAIAWASPGARKRAASQGFDIPFDRDLGDGPEPDWAGQVDQLIFRGSRFIDEVVFFHLASRTLVLADLIQNFERARLGPAARALARMGGVLDPHGGTPLDLRLSFAGRKGAARESYRRLQAWRPQKIILSHGRWYDRDAEAELQRAFRWLAG